MSNNVSSVITGSGVYIPNDSVKNIEFSKNTFYDSNGVKLALPNEEIIQKFTDISGIKERRFIDGNMVSSDIALIAAHEALISAGCDFESLDYIIFAHNFGDIGITNYRSECVPSLAARIKNHLKIKNPDTIAYDIIFGCAGWLQALIQADQHIQGGYAKKILVVAAETLSRVSDPHDRDSMLYSDGAGAVVLEAKSSSDKEGILSHYTQSYSDYAFLLEMGKSNNPEYKENNLFLKMRGRALYEHALKIVPKVIKKSIERAKLTLSDISKLLIHQANSKMITSILERLFKEYEVETIPENFMPTIISKMGNSSVATLPTLYNLIINGKVESCKINKGDTLVFASVGAGMNVNSLVYRVPV